MNSVDALGGIDVYFPRPVFDAESLLYISVKGCHYLNGEEALELVRARHLQYEPKGVNEPRYEWPQEPESDLARIVRTHFFIKQVAAKARSEFGNPLKMNSFLSAVLAQITIDSGLRGELLKIAETYLHVNLNGVPELTLPTTGVASYYYNGYGIGDVVFPVQPLDNNTVKAWDPSALPTPVKPSSVQVVSITGSYGSAVAAGQALESDGLKVASESAGQAPASTSETLVMYRKDSLAQALDVMKYLSGAVMLEQSPAVAPGTVVLDLGSTVDVKSHPVPSTTTTGVAGTTLATTTTVLTTTVPTTTSAPGPRTSTSRVAATTTTTAVPTPGGLSPSSAADVVQPWDPRSCPSGSPVING